MEELSKWFWNETFWLPAGYTWDDLQPREGGVNKPAMTDLYYTPLLAAVLLLTRFVFENFVAKPFCHAMGVTVTHKTVVENNSVCENTFTYPSTVDAIPCGSRAAFTPRRRCWMSPTCSSSPPSADRIAPATRVPTVGNRNAWSD